MAGSSFESNSWALYVAHSAGEIEEVLEAYALVLHMRKIQKKLRSMSVRKWFFCCDTFDIGI